VSIVHARTVRKRGGRRRTVVPVGREALAQGSHGAVDVSIRDGGRTPTAKLAKLVDLLEHSRRNVRPV
jgi:hypothetical protein